MSERRKSLGRFTRTLFIFWAVFFIVSVVVYSASLEFVNAHTLDVLLNATTSGNCSSTPLATPATLSLTTSAGASVVVLSIAHTGAGTARAGGAPTYGGLTMTQANSTQQATSLPEGSQEIWYLLSPPIGANSFVIPNTGGQTMSVTAGSFKAGSNQASALDAANGGNNTNVNPGTTPAVANSTTVTPTVNNDVIVSGVFSGATSWAGTQAWGTSICATVAFDTGAQGFSSGYLLQGTAAAVTPLWTFGTSDDWGEVVAAFKNVIGTTLTDGANPGAATVAPGGAITPVDTFILTTSSGSDSITAVSVNLSTNSGVGTLSISSASNCASGILGSIGGGTGSGISTGTNSITVSGLSAGTGGTTSYICVTPLSHATMPGVVGGIQTTQPGGSYAITSVINGWTGTNPKVNASGVDTSATVTIDNTSPTVATSVSGTAGTGASSNRVTINWTTPTGEAASSINSYVLQWVAASVGTDAPSEGTDPAINATIGSATVACRVTGQSSSAANSLVVGTGAGATCSSTALTNDSTPYSYRVFTRDAQGNFDAGVAINNLTPSVFVSCNATVTGTWDGAGGGTATFTNCTGTSGKPGSNDNLTINAGVIVTLTPASTSITPTIHQLTFATNAASANGLTLTPISTGGVTLTVTTSITYNANGGSTAQTITLSADNNGNKANLTPASITINAPTSTGASNITCSGTGTITVSGNVSITGNSTTTGPTTTAIGACTLNVSGTITVAGGSNATGIAKITASTGTVSAAGINLNGGSAAVGAEINFSGAGSLTTTAGITFGGATPANAKLTTTSSATINLTGTLGSGGNVALNHATSFNTNGTSTINGAYTFGDLTISTGSLTLGANIVVTDDFYGRNALNAFIPGTNSVTIGGGTYATPILSNPLNSFYDLIIAGTSIVGGETITFQSGTTVTHNLTFNATTTALTFNFSGTIILTVNGSLTMADPSAAVTTVINVGTGTLRVDGVINMNAGVTASHITKITTTTGVVNAYGGITAANATPANHVIDMSGGSGRLNLKGQWITTGGTGAAGFTFTQPATCGSTTSPIISYADTTAQTIYTNATAANGAYCNLIINNPAGATPDAALTTTNLKGDLTVGDDTAFAVFNNGAFAITGTSGKTFTVNGNATFRMTGTTNNFPTGFSTTTLDATSTEEYNQTTGFTLTSGITYGDLYFKPASGTPSFVIPTTTTINGDFVMGGAGGTPTVSAPSFGTMTVKGNWLVNTGTFTHNSSTITFSGTGTSYSVSPNGNNFNAVTFNHTGTTWSVLGSVTAAGNFTTTAGTVIGSGNLTVSGTMTGNGTVLFAGDSDGTNLVGIKQISTNAGSSLTCAVSYGGNVYCWGDGASGLLGDNNTGNHTSGIPVRVLKGAAAAADNDGTYLTNISQISRTCAISYAGNAYCWGDGLSGALGDNNTAAHTSGLPVRVLAGAAAASDTDGTNLINVSQIDTLGQTVCAVTYSRNAYCWGVGTTGVLGDNNTASHSSGVPVRVLKGAAAASDNDGTNLTNVLQIVSFLNTTCSRSYAGNAYCWGAGTNGSLGDNNTASHSSGIPVRVLAGAAAAADNDGTNLINISQISGRNPGGSGGGCAVSNAGNIYCWGFGSNTGQLGDNDTTFHSSGLPVRVLKGAAAAADNDGTYLTNVLQAAGGSNKNCAITNAGNAYCWGNGFGGVLGDNITTDHNSGLPVRVLAGAAAAADSDGTNLINVRQISNDTCAVTSTGNAYCWGNGISGRLGDNNTASHDVGTPSRVLKGAADTSKTTLVDGTVFGGTSAWTFNNLTFGDGTGTVTTAAGSTGTINVKGNLVVAVNQTLSETGTKTYDVTGNLTVTGVISGGSSTFNVTGTLTDTGTLTAASSTFNITGSCSVAGTITSFTSTFNFNGSGQTICPTSTYYNLTLSGSGAKDLTGVTTINGNLTTSGTVSTSNNAITSVGGNLIIGGGTIFTATSGTLAVAGNLANSGTFNNNSGTVSLNPGLGKSDIYLTNTTQGLKGIAVDTTNSLLYLAGQHNGSGGNNECQKFDSGGGGTGFGANKVAITNCSGNGSLNEFFGFAVDTVNNKAYASEFVSLGGDNIVRFDSGGGGTTFNANKQTLSWTNECGVAVDSGNNKVYVGGSAISMFDSGGGSTTFGANVQTYSTSVGCYVAVDTVNNKVYTNNGNSIARFDSGGGSTTFGANRETDYGSTGSGTDNFSSPTFIAVDTVDNKVYVSDTGNNRIAQFDSGGGSTTFGANVQYYGTSGSGTDNFNSPQGIAVDPVSHKVFVTDSTNSRVAWFSDGLFSPTVSGDGTTFNNLTVNAPTETIKFTSGQTFETDGVLTLAGSANNLVHINSTDGSTQWKINHQGTESTSYVDLKNSGCSTTPASTTITMDATSTDGGTNGTCWSFPTPGVTISGHIYTDESSTPYLCATNGNVTVKASRNGGTAVSVNCTADTGAYTLPQITGAQGGDVITVWVDDGTASKQGMVVTHAFNASNAITIDIMQKRVIVRHEDSSTVVNDDFGKVCPSTCTLTNANVPVTYNSSTHAVTINAGNKLIVLANKTFTPTNGSLSTTATSSAGAVDGDVLIQSGATLTMGTNALNIGGDFVNSGTFNKSSGQTTSFTGTDTAGIGFTITSGGSHFDSLTFSGTGKWTPSDAQLIDATLTMTAGTLAGSSNITVNGDVAGTAGAITRSGGTFEQRVGAAKNFGTTSSSTNWIFNDLTFSNSCSSTCSNFTVTTQNGGSGSITVNGTLTLGKGTDTAGATTTLSAGNRTWVLAGTTGTPLVITASPAAVLTPSGSDIQFIGNNSGGDTTIPVATYNSLTLGGSAAENYTIGATTVTANGNLTLNVNATLIGTGTLNVSGGGATGTGIVNLTGGTFTLSGSGSFGSTTDWNFNNLTFGGTTTSSSTSNITIAGVLTINNSSSLDAGSKVWVLNKSGAGGSRPFINNGSFTASTSTIDYEGQAATDIETTNVSYKNLKLGAAQDGGAGVTYSLNGTETVSGTISVGHGSSTNNDTFAVGANTLNLSGANITPITLAATGHGILSAASATVNYTGDGATTTAGTYNNLGLKPTGSSQQVLGSGTYNVNVNLIIGDGTSGHNGATAATNNPVINVTGTTTVAANATYTTGNGAVGLTGDLTVDGTMNGSGSGAITENGAVAGTGTINISGNTFTQNVAANKNFGTTSGTNNWTFNNLTFSSSSGTPTIATQAAGGGVIVAGTLTVGASTTLDAGNRFWTLSKTGSPFTLTGSLTPTTSTFAYTNATSATVTAATYKNLTLGGGVSGTITTPAGTTNLLGNLVVANNTTIAKGGGTFVFKIGGGNSQNWTDANATSQDVGPVQVSANTGNSIVNLGSPVAATSITLDPTQTMVTGSNALTLTAASSIITIGSGATFNIQPGSTIAYIPSQASGIVTMPGGLAYSNVVFNKSSNTFRPASGNFTVNGNLLISAGTLDLATNNNTTLINGQTTINGVLTAPAGNFSIKGNWTNNGTFNNSNGTVIADLTANTTSTAPPIVIAGSTNNQTFKNFTINGGGNVQFKASNQFNFDGLFAINGNPSFPIFLNTNIAGTQWLINISSSGSSNVNFAYIKDGGCIGGTKTLTVTPSVYGISNNGTCWPIVNQGFTTGDVSGGVTTSNISVIQSNSGQVTALPCNNPCQLTVPFTNNVQNGDTFIVYVIWSNSGNVALSDAHSNTFTSVGSAVPWHSAAYKSQLFYAKGVVGGTNYIRATFDTTITSGTFASMYIHEYRGLDYQNPLDGSSTATGTSSSLNSGNATASTSPQLIFGAGASVSSVTSGGGGFAQRIRNFTGITEDKIVASPGSYNATATGGGSSDWVMQVATFKAGATGSTGGGSTSSGQGFSSTGGGTANPAFFQNKDVNAGSAVSTASLTFTQASNPGDLIVVAVKWGDPSVTISSVTDDHGNTYIPAIGPISYASNGKAAEIFYAKGISADTTAIQITVTTSQNVSSPLIVIADEYKGFDTLDAKASATGAAASESVGPVTTTLANEMIYGVSFTDGSVSSTSGGFNSRSTISNNMSADKLVNLLGNYSVTFTGTAANWINLMVTFKIQGAESSTGGGNPTTGGTLAVDSSSPARFFGNPADNVNITSASFNPPSNSLLLALVSADAVNAGNITISVSDSSTTALTWTQIGQMDPGHSGQNGHASAWYAVQPNAGPMTVSVKRTSAGGNTNLISVKIYVVTGFTLSSPIGNTGTGSSTTNNITPTLYTSGTDNSLGFAVGTDANALGLPSSSDVYDAASYGSDSVIAGRKASVTTPSSTAVTMNLDAFGASTAAWNWVGFEVKSIPSQGGGGGGGGDGSP